MILQVRNCDLEDIDGLVRAEIMGFEEDIFSFESDVDFSENAEDTGDFEFAENVYLSVDEEEFDVFETGELAEDTELAENADLLPEMEDFEVSETGELSEENMELAENVDSENADLLPEMEDFEAQEKTVEKPPNQPVNPKFKDDILDYIRQNQGCSKEEVLRYFSNAELEKFLLAGRVILRRGGLIVIF